MTHDTETTGRKTDKLLNSEAVTLFQARADSNGGRARFMDNNENDGAVK